MQPSPPPQMPYGPTRTSGLAIAGFVCSFFCGLLGLILSIMGRNECKRSNGTVGGEGFALAGIIISSISLALGAIGILAAIAIPAFMDYSIKSKRTEADLQLLRLERSAKSYAISNGAFPRATAPLTPATPCCEGAGHKCSDTSGWSVPAWQELEFQIDEPHLFRYEYQSDGKTFIARAVGDLDCDGTTVTHEIRGTVQPDGNPAFEHVAPTNTD